MAIIPQYYSLPTSSKIFVRLHNNVTQDFSCPEKFVPYIQHNHVIINPTEESLFPYGNNPKAEWVWYWEIRSNTWGIVANGYLWYHDDLYLIVQTDEEGRLEDLQFALYPEFSPTVGETLIYWDDLKMHPMRITASTGEHNIWILQTPYDAYNRTKLFTHSLYEINDPVVLAWQEESREIYDEHLGLSLEADYNLVDVQVKPNTIYNKTIKPEISNTNCFLKIGEEKYRLFVREELVTKLPALEQIGYDYTPSHGYHRFQQTITFEDEINWARDKIWIPTPPPGHWEYTHEYFARYVTTNPLISTFFKNIFYYPEESNSIKGALISTLPNIINSKKETKTALTNITGVRG